MINHKIINLERRFVINFEFNIFFVNHAILVGGGLDELQSRHLYLLDGLLGPCILIKL